MKITLDGVQFEDYMLSLDREDEVWFEVLVFDEDLKTFYPTAYCETPESWFSGMQYDFDEDTDFIIDIPEDFRGFVREWFALMDEEAREGCLMRG